MQAVDALAPEDLPDGPVTFFNAFHHFTAEQQLAIVRTLAGRGVFVFEVLQPNAFVFLKILFTTTIGQLLLTPFVRPFRWSRLFFTYVLPINLVTVPWDGLVSVLRVDTAATLKERFLEAAPTGTKVEAGVVGPWWAPITWAYVLPAT
jgi:hypothetical protein